MVHFKCIHNVHYYELFNSIILYSYSCTVLACQDKQYTPKMMIIVVDETFISRTDIHAA